MSLSALSERVNEALLEASVAGGSNFRDAVARVESCWREVEELLIAFDLEMFAHEEREIALEVIEGSSPTAHNT